MDLNAPLGMGPPPRSRRGFVAATAGALSALALAGIGYMLAVADPHGGEPYAVATLPLATPSPRAAVVPSSLVDTDPTGSLASVRNNAPVAPGAGGHADVFDDGTVENGVKVFRGANQGATQTPPPVPTGPLVIDVSSQLDGGLKSRAGVPAPGAVSKPVGGPATSMPRVAIYISGMGLSQTATQTAIDTMPPAVSLAFLPYVGKASASADAARAKGHEVLLQLPMQNAQGSSPGPHSLKPDETPDALASDLEWLTTRFDGYVGVTNLLGAPVTANTATMSAVLKATAARNLFFLDDGTSKRSVAPSLATQMNVAEAQADIVLDATADPAVVRANLDSLVAIARRKGQAIGMASGLPEHLGTIARFAAELSSKKIALVPVSALARREATVATNVR